MADTSPDSNDDHSSTSPSDAVQPSMTMHPISYSGVPMHMYSFPPGMVTTQPARTKRRQVKNACTNCQKACKKCDDARPCLRCVKYGIAEECVDSQRKERQKGIKRGPYKKRDGKANNAEPQGEASAQQATPAPAPAMAAPAAPPMPYMAPMGYPAGFYPQYGPPTGKPGEPPAYAYPQYYFAPIPMPPPQTGQDGEGGGYAAGFYPATFIAPYAQQAYPGAPMPYMVPVPAPAPRPDGQQQMPMVPPPMQYAPYPQAYPKQPSRENGNELPPQMMDPGRRDPRMDPYSARMSEGMVGPHSKSS